MDIHDEIVEQTLGKDKSILEKQVCGRVNFDSYKGVLVKNLKK